MSLSPNNVSNKQYFYYFLVLGVLLLIASAIINIVLSKYFPTVNTKDCLVNVNLKDPQNIKIESSNCNIKTTLDENQQPSKQ
ncbi:MAG: hypothetical protein [Bacteriophage sp.]|nr:MAG: hypothetical protein [Bacteriophage sp.]